MSLYEPPTINPHTPTVDSPTCADADGSPQLAQIQEIFLDGSVRIAVLNETNTGPSEQQVTVPPECLVRIDQPVPCYVGQRVTVEGSTVSKEPGGKLFGGMHRNRPVDGMRRGQATSELATVIAVHESVSQPDGQRALDPAITRTHSAFPCYSLKLNAVGRSDWAYC